MLYAYRYQSPSGRPKILKLLSVLFLGCGVVLVSIVAYPLLSFQWGSTLANPGLLSPVASSKIGLVSPVVASSDQDNTNVRSWFPPDSKISDSLFPDEPLYYSISIPKLNITNAIVEHGGTNLKKNLIAWPTSVKPGEAGTVFIFGHSALPSFYNPRSYTAIFTRIYDLAYGAEILVNYDGVRYKYEVEAKKIVEPNDFSILEQKYDRSRLILITCVPPGTLDKRGLVTAKLVKV